MSDRAGRRFESQQPRCPTCGSLETPARTHINCPPVIQGFPHRDGCPGCKAESTCPRCGHYVETLTLDPQHQPLSYAEYVREPPPVWPQEVKELAYKLDPECWVSYSGKPKKFKSFMEQRRLASLKRAAREWKPPTD